MNATAALEARVWAACADLVELPDELTALLADAARVQAEQQKLVEEIGPPTSAERFVAGERLDKAVELSEQEQAELRRRHEARRTVANARELVARRLAIWVASHRDELIHAARPAVDRILDEARPLANKLPTFDPEAIARSAKPAQVAAWQRLQELQSDFDLIVAACVSTWKAASRTGGQQPGAQRAAAETRDAPPALRLWANPGAVTSALMRGETVNFRGRQRRIPTNLAAIAAEPEEAGFRLAGIAELAEAMRDLRHAEREERRGKRARAV